MTRRIGWLVLVAAIGLAGCSSSGTNPTEPSDGGAGSAGAGGALGTCANGDPCVPPAPPGWQGPAALYIDEYAAPVEPCPTVYSKSDDTVYAGLNAGSLSCNCSCVNPHGACTATADFVDVNCSGNPPEKTVSVSTGDCVDAALAGNIPIAVRISAATADGTCDGKLDGEFRDTPAWTSKARLCELNAPPGCGSGFCAPKPADPFLKLICIYKDGVDTCPNDYGLAQQHFYRSFLDDRKCDCQCGTLEGATCDGSVTLYTGSCGSSTSLDVAFGACAASGVNFLLALTQSLDTSAVPSGGTCAVKSATGGLASGTEPVTVCCR